MTNMSSFTVNDIEQELKDPLYVGEDKSPFKLLLKTVEDKSGKKVKREWVLYGLMGLLAFYLIVGHYAALVCNAIGFGYPAIASMAAIKSKTKDDDTQWLTYWTVFGVFSLFDFASDVIYKWCPIYWALKAFFFIWLFKKAYKMAGKKRGAELIWEKFLGPAYDKYGPMVGDMVAKLSGGTTGAVKGASTASYDPKDD